MGSLVVLQRRRPVSASNGSPTSDGGRSRERSTPAEATLPAGDAQSDPPTMLIVDDDPLMTDLLPRKLKRTLAGCRILTATTPDDGIRLAREARPAVVLSDYNLRAALTGLDVLDEVARIDPAIIRILFTGHARHEIGPRLDRSDLHGFIEKPLRLDEMMQPLLDILRTRGFAPAGAPP